METALVVQGARFFSPVGELVLRASSAGLVEVLWPRAGEEWPGDDRPRKEGQSPEEGHPVLARAVEALSAYFRGRPLSVDVPLDLSALTPFRRRVMLALRSRVPSGQVVSYGELALLAGHPGAARAVGGVMARNPLPLFVPCHRVVGISGPGGFGPGLPCKRALLRHEGFELEI